MTEDAGGYLCKHCNTCQEYTYERLSKKGKLITFQYCEEGKQQVGLSNWYIQKDGYAYSTKRVKNGKKVFYHSLFNDDPTLVVDHINGVRNDNRLKNLRVITPLSNAQNNHYVKKTSRFYGVCWNKKMNKWVASTKRGKQGRQGVFHLGTFDSEFQAFHEYVKFLKNEGVTYFEDYPAWGEYLDWLDKRAQTTLI